MKKIVIALVLAVLVTGGAFAEFSMSAGGGLLLDMSFGNGLEGYGYEMSLDTTSIGAFGFFDATYVDVSVYLAYGFGTLDIIDYSFDIYATQFGFTLLGKFPIDLGGFTLFPAIGIGYNMVLSASSDDGDWDEPSDFSQFGILFGAGADFPLGDTLFIRTKALFNLRFPSKFMDDMSGDGFDTTLGMGPRIEVGVGFKL